MRRRRVVILGATGSIGESARKVARDIPERMEIVGMSAHSNEDKLRAAGADFPEAKLAVSSRPDGAERLVELATLPEADLVLIAIVGTGGLRPALAAIEAGKDIAVASKEILVMAGEAVMNAARSKEVQVLPVDSEHNAIFQCLDGRMREKSLPASPANGTSAAVSSRNADVRRLILTASGGPFRTWPAEQLAGVTLEQALKHPTWKMGAKITIDSATLFNKGLEMIEARWLFDVEMARVEVIVHPQSIIHSMVEFIDSSVLAQLSVTDMCFPIQYAVTWPERVPNSLAPLDFARLARLEFEAPRVADFPALDLARAAGETGGTLPAVLNAANEVAVAAFLGRRCSFPTIWKTVDRIMAEHRSVAGADLAAILEADHWARTRAAALLA
ncbi:MAG: 1-deoxy-D-xylulose-5-phosphate reductoisomerase [Chthoniobacter sp.]|jgi:1-deoxy-D-xylulose-5-phosphate reductoisomerase|nr:1-deoxy-D-xylulose-5-phosphate reductoisomerase [Chthoniobacter sp.]